MSLLYLFIKLYPFFGLALLVLCIDLARHFKRNANKAWIGFVIMAVIFLISTAYWIFRRGDLHADVWVEQVSFWLHLR